MTTLYPSLNHGLSEELSQVRAMVSDFARDHIATRAADIDKTTISHEIYG